MSAPFIYVCPKCNISGMKPIKKSTSSYCFWTYLDNLVEEHIFPPWRVRSQVCKRIHLERTLLYTPLEALVFRK